MHTQSAHKSLLPRREYYPKGHLQLAGVGLTSVVLAFLTLVLLIMRFINQPIDWRGVATEGLLIVLFLYESIVRFTLLKWIVLSSAGIEFHGIGHKICIAWENVEGIRASPEGTIALSLNRSALEGSAKVIGWPMLRKGDISLCSFDTSALEQDLRCYAPSLFSEKP